jgi:glycosyltransferase involved in cell wall biosynthesis
MKVTIFHNAGDFSYLFGLVNGLMKAGNVSLDIIDADQSIEPFKLYDKVKVYNFILPYKKTINPVYRIYRVLSPYLKNINYARKTDSRLFHIQWFNRISWIDKLFLVHIYKFFNKKVIYTAHNVNTLARNGKDNFWNRFTLKYFYRSVDHIIVHTKKSKKELMNDFRVKEEKISVIKFGLNIFTPQKGISKSVALKKLNLPPDKKIILFFGAINVYKGLENLIYAFQLLLDSKKDYHLVIAGESRDNKYFSEIRSLINEKIPPEFVSVFFEYIPDEDIELFFNAADCLVLPYKSISQSGVHFLSYSFGLPVIATDVGSFKEEDIIENKTGFVCKPDDPEDLAEAIIRYFDSELYTKLDQRRAEIKEWASQNYSWDSIGKQTLELYKKLLSDGK